ncbi:hypothetical protein VTO42DRAFT_3850 [Malbranchea cinnamomea]
MSSLQNQDQAVSSSLPLGPDRATSSSPTPSTRGRSPVSGSLPRHIVTARLASPVPSASDGRGPSAGPGSSPRHVAADRNSDFQGIEPGTSYRGPGPSALGAALHKSPRNASPHESLSKRAPSPPADKNASKSLHIALDNGDTSSQSQNGGQPTEDLDIVKRHLVRPQDLSEWQQRRGNRSGTGPQQNKFDDEFSSLKLQGGDITRPIYRWTEGAESEAGGSRRRRSFHVPRPEPECETLDINTIKVPGGFRRDYLRRTAGNSDAQGLLGSINQELNGAQPRLLTSNFLEFLTLFGHFAGEELEEDDEVLGPDEYFAPSGEEEIEPGEETALLRPETPGKHPRKPKERAAKATNSATGAMLLLLKSFVGTGVLFLPRAFLNGGMLFSSVVLVAVSLLSFYCFILLVNTRMRIVGSFGDIGGALYGKWMRMIILGSVALSQFGFVAAYIVFVSANLQAFVLAVTNCSTYLGIKFMILIQLIIFLPLSLIRDISKLAFTALVADVFILLGLIYLYGVNIWQIVDQGGIADIKAFNPTGWTLLIGTAIFTYEGIGLIIPIQESMKRPQQFPSVLALVMVIVTTVFLSMGVLGYATFGSATETVIILNLNQKDRFVNAVQFLYAIAILLSTPLQLFPAIRILENGLFTRSGKYNPGIKWKKNVFRFFLVGFCSLVAWGGAADLDKFVALVGSFACVPLVYVYPPMLHLKAVASSRLQRSADITLTIFGVILCIYTTILTIQNWAAGSPDSGKPGQCDV